MIHPHVTLILLCLNTVWVGGGARIIGPCKIGDGVTLAAGSVARGVLEPYCVYGGEQVISSQVNGKRVADIDGSALRSLVSHGNVCAGVPARLLKRLKRPEEEKA